MTSSKKVSSTSTLTDLLNQEHKALLEGDLDQVTKLFATKEALFDQICVDPPNDIGEMRKLEKKIKRNHLLLDGALEGIRRVADRMTALKRVQTSIDTYGADGCKQKILLKPTSTIERRA